MLQRELQWPSAARLVEGLFWAALGLLFLDRTVGAWFELRELVLTDQNAYPALARASHFFFDSGEREPLHVFLVKIALAMTEPDERAIRAVGLVETLALLPAVVVWMRLRHGFVAAVAAAAALCSNRFLVFYGVQGFNVSTYLLALAGFAALLDAPETSSTARAVALGAGAGLVSLARIEGLLVASASTVAQVAAVRASVGEKVRFLCWFAASLGVLLAPHLTYQWARYGSPLHRLELDARFWASTEAIEEGKLVPDATREAGGPLKLHRYLLEGGVAALVTRLATGYRDAFSRYLPRLVSGAYWILALAAVGFAVLTRRRRWALPALALFVILPISFILPVDQVAPGSGVEMRFLLPAIVPMCALCGVGAGCLASAAGSLLRRLGVGGLR
jgi:hypothetical protein